MAALQPVASAREPDRAEQLMRDQILHSRQLVLDTLVRRYTVMTQAVGLDPLTRPATAPGGVDVQQPTARRGLDRAPSSSLRASSRERQTSRAAGGAVR